MLVGVRAWSAWSRQAAETYRFATANPSCDGLAASAPPENEDSLPRGGGNRSLVVATGF